MIVSFSEYYTNVTRTRRVERCLYVIHNRVMTMRGNNRVHAIGSQVRSRVRYINLPWKIRTAHSPGGSCNSSERFRVISQKMRM